VTVPRWSSLWPSPSSFASSPEIDDLFARELSDAALGAHRSTESLGEVWAHVAAQWSRRDQLLSETAVRLGAIEDRHMVCTHGEGDAMAL